VSQGEALGTKIERNGGVGRPGHVAGEHDGTPAMKKWLGVGNAALPALDNGNGGEAEVEEALAKLLAGWLGRRRRGKLGRSR